MATLENRNSNSIREKFNKDLISLQRMLDGSRSIATPTTTVTAANVIQHNPIGPKSFASQA